MVLIEEKVPYGTTKRSKMPDDKLSEILTEDLADRKKVDNIDAKKMTTILDSIYNKALNGIPRVSRSVDDIVADYTSKFSDVRAASKELVKYQIAKCGTSGFLAGLGGIITLPVAVPANVGRVLYVQIRMIAAIAKMGGFDIHSDQVQTLVYACLTGGAVADVIRKTGIQIGEKISEAAIARIPVQILATVNKKVGFCLISQFGTEGTVNLMGLVPIAGGVIGGAIDVAFTKIVANNAISIFIDKKIPGTRKDRRKKLEVVQ